MIKTYAKQNSIFLLFFVAVALFFYLCRFPSFYNATIGLLLHITGSDNYGAPFTTPNFSNLIHWDSWHYHEIKQNMYEHSKNGDPFMLAFFPLWPLVWQGLHLSIEQTIIFNALLFFTGATILLKALKIEANQYIRIMLLCVPTVVVFFMPYSESLFFLTTAIGIYGLINKKYYIYFIGIFLASATRASITILALSIVCTEAFFLFGNYSLTYRLKSLLSKLLPVIAGTVMVIIIQKQYFPGSIFGFINAQKTWGHTFSIPTKLVDWSQQGYGMNMACLFIIATACLGGILWLTFRQIFNANKITENPVSYLQILSATYLLGVTFFILFYQAGSLNGLSRYILCSPYFIFLLLSLQKTILKISLYNRILLFTLPLTLTLVVAYNTEYTQPSIYIYAGFLNIVSVLFLWMFNNYSKHNTYKALQLLTFASNIMWTAYLFNLFLTSPYLFT